MSMDTTQTSADVNATLADEDALASSNKDATGAIADQAKNVADQAKGAATDVLNQTQQVAGQAIEQAKGALVTQIKTQKDNAVGALDGLTQALHQTGQSLRQSGQGVFGDYADTLAGQLDQAIGYLKQNDVEDLARQTQEFARSQPALFLGGAFVLGIAVARFLKSSNEPIAQTQPTNGFTATTNGYQPVSNANTSDNTGINPSGPSVSAPEAPSNTHTDAPGSYIPSSVYENADTSRHLDQFSDDAIPSSGSTTAHGYVAGVGITGDETADRTDNNIAAIGSDNE
jgi:uncharacterized protein YjbJ (UPF0337 family)